MANKLAYQVGDHVHLKTCFRVTVKTLNNLNIMRMNEDDVYLYTGTNEKTDKYGNFKRLKDEVLIWAPHDYFEKI
jgi:hypothetical protein